uniref:Uncharacterized protein n=1 Tax=Acrobeloides nanus TaxID=290746 RepID=A0A914E7Y4_9BILA
MPKNFFKDLFGRKKVSNKENIDIADKFNRQVTFRHSNYEPNGGSQKYTYHGEDIDLSNPTAPYHTKTAPKRRKGPRSCPGGPGQDFDDDCSQNSGELNRSFQSEFVTTSRPSKSARRRNNHFRPNYDGENSMANETQQRQPFSQANNGNSYVNQSMRLDRSRYQEPNESMDSSSNGGDWELSKEHVMKMQQQVVRYQKKLAKAISRERLARQELEQEKNRRIQSENRLHQRIYDLEQENLRLRTCLEYEQGQRRMREMSYPSYDPSRFLPTPNMIFSMNTATTSSVATADGAGEHLASRSNMPFPLLNLETPDETKVFRQNDSDVLSQRPAGTPLMSNISTSSVDFGMSERPRASSKLSSSSILTLTQRKPHLLHDDGYGTTSVADDSVSMRSRFSTKAIPQKRLRRSCSLILL